MDSLTDRVGSFVYSRLTFYETDDHFYFTPNEPNSKKVMAINRNTMQITLDENRDPLSKAYFIKIINGIFGIIKLIAGNYLLLITKTSQVGDIFGAPIYRIDNVEIVAFNPRAILTDSQEQFNRQYLKMLEKILKTPNFYCSYSFDLSHTLQNLYSFGPDFPTKGVLNRSNKKFVWNKNLLSEFSMRKELEPFCIPIIYGFFSMNEVIINQKKFIWILISRRSVDRAGTRMFYRGIDENGDVANFVETEQILINEATRCSFVQVRGSIPIHWTQMPDLRYKPPVTIDDASELQLHSFQTHLKFLLRSYTNVCMVNLINHKGHEEGLLKSFRQTVQQTNSSQVRMENFDFHHECSKNRWDRLSILMQQIDNEIKEYGSFCVTSSGQVLNLQEGVFRTNCIDSLDRTNVVQSLIAKSNLEIELQRLGIMRAGERIEHFPEFYSVYRNVWADNADVVSKQYAGTGALKSDFTRTGKRRFTGKLKDGLNSMIRYYKNNFEDGFRQDSIDLILGNYVVDENEGKSVKCPLGNRHILKVFTFPLFLLASILMFVFSLLLPTEHLTEKFFYLLFWFSMSSACFVWMFFYGKEFVDYPTLVNIRKVKSY